MLIGSTEKMGVGANVQARAVALHHLDCPWRPADIEQRDGRILRQGNQSPEVPVLRYLTEGSFDTSMWQTLERKATFIEQVPAATSPGARSTTSPTPSSPTPRSRRSPLATRSSWRRQPLTLRSPASSGWSARADEQHRFRNAFEAAQRQAASLRHKAHRLHEAIARRVDTRGDAFRMTIGGQTFDKRAEAGARLAKAAAELMQSTGYGQTWSATVGQLAGFDIEVEVTRAVADEVTVRTVGGLVDGRWSVNEWHAAEPSRLVTSIERRLFRLEDEHDAAIAGADKAATEATRAKARLRQGFERGRQLMVAQRRRAR